MHPDVDSLLARINSSAVSAGLLAGLFEFDITRTAPVEEVRLASGMPLDAVAGDAAGGSFFVCGASPPRPVIYASSEGEAGLIATDLVAALDLIVGLPYWRDCLHFSAGGSLDEMRLAAARLADDLMVDVPTVEQKQAQLRLELGLSQLPTDEMLAALHSSITRTVPDFVLVGPDGGEYESLFGSFRVRDNPGWP
jgi:hypothetical protein